MCWDILFKYLAVVNVLAFVTFGVDKLKAMRGSWRIKEMTLLMLAVIGGSVGALLAMYLFRHKISGDHRKFYLGIPVLLLLQVGSILYFYM